MRGLLALADVILMGQALGNFGNNLPIVQKSKIGHKLMLLSGLLLGVGTVMVLCGVFLEIAKAYSPERAAGVTGGILIVIAMICALGAYVFERVKARKIKEVKDEITDAIFAVLDLAEEAVAKPVRENPKTSIASAAVAGYVAGEAMN